MFSTTTALSRSLFAAERMTIGNRIRNRNMCMMTSRTLSTGIARRRTLHGSTGSTECRFVFVGSRSNVIVRRDYSTSRATAMSFVYPPEVTIVEVGPRDGLQNESTVSTANKIALIQKLAAAGCRRIEAGSFVSPKWVPSMADTTQVMQGLNAWRNSNRNHPPVQLSCLVPNVHGLEQALAVGGIDEIAIFASASETFSQKNINCSIAESMQRFQPVAALAAQHDIPVRAYLSCVMACPYEGRIAPHQVATVVEQLVHITSCHELSLGDTIGAGTAHQTQQMLREVQQALDMSSSSSTTSALPSSHCDLAVHFHDTYGQALANILVALDAGITVIDTAVAGLGGCPYAVGAAGNVATEDVLFMMQGLGTTTNIDLDQMVVIADWVCGSDVLNIPSRSKAGTALAARTQHKRR